MGIVHACAHGLGRVVKQPFERQRIIEQSEEFTQDIHTFFNRAHAPLELQQLVFQIRLRDSSPPIQKKPAGKTPRRVEFNLARWQILCT